MKFIETFKLKSKLFLLFILITIGLVILGLTGTINVKEMKSRIDGLYFGTLIPVTELHDILYTYNANIAVSIYKVKYDLIDNATFEAQMMASLQTIRNRWQSYASHYKSYDELAYVRYASQTVMQTNEFLLRLVAASKLGKNLQKISLRTVEAKIANVNTTLQKLLDYEMEVARLDRQRFRKSYENTMQTVSIMLALIILGVLFVTYLVFQSIQRENTKLEIMTKKLKQANKKLENASYTDSLTGLHNRRYFNFIYAQELKRAKREKKYITFMMIDIDYFKQYNDTYGHIAGDHTLKIVARVMKSCFRRPSDFVFRLGGEEFGVLLLDTDEINSARLAKELCQKVKEQEIEHKSSKVARVVTISVGVVSCIADETLEEEALLKRADDMLYKAKESGRDRYMITSEIIASSQNVSEIPQGVANF